MRNDDTDEVASSKIQELCDYVSMLGIFKISDAELIRGLTSKQGVLLSFHVSNNDEYDMMFNHDGVLQKLANDYDDRNGLTVIRKNRNPVANQSYTSAAVSARTVRKDLIQYGVNISGLKLYEYKDDYGHQVCIHVNEKENDIIRDFMTHKYLNKTIRTDIRVFKKEQ